MWAGRCRRHGRVRWASRPPRGRTTGCRPTSSTSADEVWPGGDGRLHPGGCRGTSAEQERRDGRPGHQACHAGTTRTSWSRPTWAMSSQGWTAEAVHRTKRPEDRNANARPHETVHGAPEDVEKQPATEFRVLQDNANRFQHNKDLTNRRIKAVEDVGAFRAPTNAASSFNPQYGDVQQLRAVDSMTVRSTEGRETLLKLALPAPQGSGNAAGRLTRRGRPAAVRQLDDFLAPPRRRTLD